MFLLKNNNNIRSTPRYNFFSCSQKQTHDSSRKKFRDPCQSMAKKVMKGKKYISRKMKCVTIYPQSMFSRLYVR